MKTILPVSPITDARRYVADLIGKEITLDDYLVAVWALDDLDADALLNDADNDDL
jgi:hypothetical protein